MDLNEGYWLLEVCLRNTRIVKATQKCIMFTKFLKEIFKFVFENIIIAVSNNCIRSLMLHFSENCFFLQSLLK